MAVFRPDTVDNDSSCPRAQRGEYGRMFEVLFGDRPTWRYGSWSPAVSWARDLRQPAL
jgi:hypothetical protein